MYQAAKQSNFTRIESVEDLFSRNINDYFSAVDRDLQNLFTFSNIAYTFGSGSDNEVLQYNADTGSITYVPSLGGWNIGGDLLWSGASATYIGLKPGDGIWLGDEAFLTAPFSVDAAGVLTAHSGTVAGWNLTESKLWKGTDLSSDYISLNPLIGIHMGTEEFSTANFSVTKEGALKAISGTISGWTMSENILFSGSGGSKIAFDTNEGIYMGSDTLGSAPFSVDRNGYMRATITELTAPIIQTNANPGTDRVVINSSGIRGYDDVLGTTFILPTDGTSPIFANGIIQSATIIDTTIISNDFKTSSELPWVEMTDEGIAYRETLGGSLYGDGSEYGDGSTYGVGVTALFGNSAKPSLSIEAERTFADIRLYNRSADLPSSLSKVGDIICVSAVPKFCTAEGEPGTYKDFLLDGSALPTAGAIDSTGAMTLSLDSDTAAALTIFNNNAGSNRYSEIKFARDNGDAPTSIRSVAVDLGVDNKSKLEFYTAASAQALVKRLTIDEAGLATFTAGVTATGFTGPLTGLASSASVLSPGREINGVAFDGSQNIAVTAAAATLTGDTIKSTVLNSSLTSLGTITSLVATAAEITTADINGGTANGLTSFGMSAGVDITEIENNDALGTSDTKLCTQGNVKAYADSLVNVDAAAGDILHNQNDGTTGTVATTYGKVKEFTILRDGEYRIKFSLTGADGYGKIYKNGVAVGTERNVSTSPAYTEYSEDISGWSEGDLCQLYVHDTPGNGVISKNFRIYSSLSELRYKNSKSTTAYIADSASPLTAAKLTAVLEGLGLI